MPKKFWWPGNKPAQVVLMQNFSTKIGQYKAALPLTQAQIDAGIALCTSFIGAFNATEAAKQTMLR